MDRKIKRFSDWHGITQKPKFSTCHPWEGAINAITSKLRSTANQLRFLGCHTQRLPASLVKNIIDTLALSVATKNSEV